MDMDIGTVVMLSCVPTATDDGLRGRRGHDSIVVLDGELEGVLCGEYGGIRRVGVRVRQRSVEDNAAG